MSRVYWDTMLFVYWLEDHPLYASVVEDIYLRMRQREDQLFTSAFTLGEILVGPYKAGSDAAVCRIRQLFSSAFLRVIPYTADTADHYAGIRAQHAVSPADAIHLACAAQSRIDLFLTNDSRLIGKKVQGIQFIAGLDSKLL